jgi:xanthine/CO dehydrogenase XdhC/CoxF family maturation factor
MNNIFTTLLYQMEKHHDTVLCTIIADNGSTPRGRGAQMLVAISTCATLGYAISAFDIIPLLF